MIILAGVVLILAGLALSIWRGRLPLWYWKAFLLGGLIGLVWEIGFTFGGMGYPILPGGAPNPDGMDIDQFPLPAIAVMLAMVCVWDGGLFCVGLVAARELLGEQVERAFSWQALGVMLLWGQIQSLVIEIYAIRTGMWAYAEEWWNPKLFDYGAAQITLVPQLVWAVGFAVFYLGVLAIARSANPPRA